MHHTEDTRAFFMVTDCRFITPDDPACPGVLSEGEVQIFDMKGTTMRHISRLTISTLRAYVKFLQLAFPVRLKAIHMVNCPTYIDRIVSIVKPFISDEVFKLVRPHKASVQLLQMYNDLSFQIRFHTANIDSLYAFVPCVMLPEEYGGAAGSLASLRERTQQVLSENR